MPSTLSLAVAYRGTFAVPGQPVQAAQSGGEAALALCDGTGSWGSGLSTSRLGARVLVKTLLSSRGQPEVRLREAIRETNREVEASAPDPDDPFEDVAFSGLVALVREGQCWLAWAGSCQAFLLEPGRVVARTRPNLLADALLASGQLSEAELRSFPAADVITRALATRVSDPAQAAPSLAGPWPLGEGQTLVLVSSRLLEAAGEEGLLALAAGPRQAESLEGWVQHHQQTHGRPGEYLAALACLGPG